MHWRSVNQNIDKVVNLGLIGLVMKSPPVSVMMAITRTTSLRRLSTRNTVRRRHRQRKRRSIGITRRIEIATVIGIVTGTETGRHIRHRRRSLNFPERSWPTSVKSTTAWDESWAKTPNVITAGLLVRFVLFIFWLYDIHHFVPFTVGYEFSSGLCL